MHGKGQAHAAIRVQSVFRGAQRRRRIKESEVKQLEAYNGPCVLAPYTAVLQFHENRKYHVQEQLIRLQSHWREYKRKSLETREKQKRDGEVWHSNYFMFCKFTHVIPCDMQTSLQQRREQRRRRYRHFFRIT